jgi:GH15 family glucan-1,4-alpha-glucosidase
MLYRDDNGELQVDGTCDSSLWGLFAFGLYTGEDPRIDSTMKALEQKLWVPTETGGMARYENDSYYRSADRVPGNPWFISTLWLADYYIEKGKMEEGLRLLRWVEKHALASGVLAEQVHPNTGEPLSVSPLTWSHAAFLTTVKLFQLRMEEMERGVPGVKMRDWIGKLFAETCDQIHGACQVK